MVSASSARDTAAAGTKRVPRKEGRSAARAHAAFRLPLHLLGIDSPLRYALSQGGGRRELKHDDG